MSEIHIISCGVGDELSPSRLLIIEKSDIIAGGKQLLDQFGIDEAKRRYLTAHAVSEITALVQELSQGRSAVVLGSGDALFHGIGSTVKKATEKSDIALHFYPAPSAFQHLCHRKQIPWNELKSFSVHGGEPLPIREILRTKLAVVYGGSYYSATDIARALCRFYPPAEERPALVADRLSYENEQIIQGTLGGLSLESVSATSMLLLLEPETPVQIPLSMQGTPNTHFLHDDGLITSEEVRAIVLGKLRLPYHGVVWDIGAGSGSVGIEIAGMYPEIEIHAVEKNPHRSEMIQENISRFGLANVFVHCGNAGERIGALPAPDRVFVGGGGADIIPILEECYERLAVGGIIVCTAVTIETLLAVQAWKKRMRGESLTVDIARENPLGSTNYHLYRSCNRITIFIVRK